MRIMVQEQSKIKMLRICLSFVTLALYTNCFECFMISSSIRQTSNVITSTTVSEPKKFPNNDLVVDESFITLKRKRTMELYFFNIFGIDDNNNKISTETTTTTTTTGKSKTTITDDKKEQKQVVSTTNNNDDKDPIEKIFSFFFGEPEEEPFGLKRFGANRFPEQYPATVDEWADPVTTDTKDMAYIRPLLKNTNLEFRSLMCTYDANKHGWDAYKFHQKVDKKGGGIVVCKTNNGLICGGYNPKGWVGYGEARGSIAAFLFRQDNNVSSGFKKLRKVGGAGMAQIDNPESAIMFGADSLIISLNNKNNPKMARSKLGSYYERLSDGTNTLFDNKDPAVQLVDLKVYHGVYEDGEFIPFSDADPFALN